MVIFHLDYQKVSHHQPISRWWTTLKPMENSPVTVGNACPGSNVWTAPRFRAVRGYTEVLKQLQGLFRSTLRAGFLTAHLHDLWGNSNESITKKFNKTSTMDHGYIHRYCCLMLQRINFQHFLAEIVEFLVKRKKWHTDTQTQSCNMGEARPDDVTPYNGWCYDGTIL